MSKQKKLNLYTINQRLDKIEETCDPPIEEMSNEINKLIERIDTLEKVVLNINAQLGKKEKPKNKPAHPEVWDPAAQARPKNWGRGYAPPVQKTEEGTKAKPQKGK